MRVPKGMSRKDMPFYGMPFQAWRGNEELLLQLLRPNGHHAWRRISTANQLPGGGATGMLGSGDACVKKQCSFLFSFLEPS